MNLLPAPAGPLLVSPGHDDAIGLSLVVPTYNEGANIAGFLDALGRVLGTALGESYEVIVVDDDSPDRTWEIAARAAAPRVRVVRRQNERGLASAVIRGWQVGRGAVLGTINADFQHPPEVLGCMLPLISDADVVVATRHAEGGGLGDWGWHRSAASAGARLLGRALLPQVFNRTSDPLSGCYIFRRCCIAGIELRPLGYKSLMEILARGKAASVRECGYQMRARRHGKSKVGARQHLEYIRHLLMLRAALRRK